MDHDGIARLARRQHGVVARWQLVRDGNDADAVDAAVRSDRLQRVARGVYALPGAPPTLQREATVAALRCSPRARIVGERMLALTGNRQARPDAPVVVLLPAGRRVVNVPWPVRAGVPCAVDPAGDGGRAVWVDGVPSVSPARNLLEAAIDLSPERLADVVDGARWQGRACVVAARRLAERTPGHAGAVALLGSGLLDGDAPESSPERRLAALLAHHRPTTQACVLPGVRVDLLVPAVRLVVEYDGWATHSSPAARRQRRARDDRLRAAGFVVVHVTAADLRDPAALVARIDGLVDLLAG